MSDEGRPPRCTIANIETAQTVSAQFNPTEIKETLAVVFNKPAIMGLSHSPMQYQRTENLALSFDLTFDAISANGSIKTTELARRFLHSMCYSRRGAAEVSGGGPPRTLFRWPKLYSVKARITGITITQKRYALRTGELLGFQASLTIEEALTVRLYSEDVLERGTLR